MVDGFDMSDDVLLDRLYGAFCATLPPAAVLAGPREVEFT